jgi:hypothetical protein
VYLDELFPKDCKSECSILLPLKNTALFSTNPTLEDKDLLVIKPVPLFKEGSPVTYSKKFA